MLRQARDAAATFSGRPEQGRHPYGTPQPREAVRHASVGLLDYPSLGRMVAATNSKIGRFAARAARTSSRRDGSITLSASLDAASQATGKSAPNRG